MPARPARIVDFAHARDRTDVRPHGERERDLLTLSPPPPTSTARRARTLRPHERALVRFLRDQLGTSGAAAMVLRFGAANVIDAVRDLNPQRVVEQRGIRGADGTWYPTLYRWTFPGLRTPGGFLRRTLEERELMS